MRRRLRAVLDVIGSIRGSGFSAMGEGSSFCLQGTFTEEQLVVVSVLGLPGMGDAVGATHDELDKFLRAVVVRRRDWAVQGWSACVIEDSLLHSYRRLRHDLVLPFLQCDPSRTVEGSGIFSDLALIDREF